jgi:hypothetical protein
MPLRHILLWPSYIHRLTLRSGAKVRKSPSPRCRGRQPRSHGYGLMTSASFIGEHRPSMGNCGNPVPKGKADASTARYPTPFGTDFSPSSSLFKSCSVLAAEHGKELAWQDAKLYRSAASTHLGQAFWRSDSNGLKFRTGKTLQPQLQIDGPGMKDAALQN